MPEQKKTKQSVMATEHTPVRDASGALRLDRVLTPEEAAAVDQHNAKEHQQSRAARFARRVAGR
jgi:hypothetical protein